MRALILAMMLTSCAHMSPIGPPTPSQAYSDAFAKCMEQQGIQAAPNIGLQVFQILETPNQTQAQILQAWETLGIATLTGGAQATAMCALQAWVSLHPIAPAGKPTPAQAAARVMRARLDHGTGVWLR